MKTKKIVRSIGIVLFLLGMNFYSYSRVAELESDNPSQDAVRLRSCAGELRRAKALVYQSFQLFGDLDDAGTLTVHHVRQRMARQGRTGHVVRQCAHYVDSLLGTFELEMNNLESLNRSADLLLGVVARGTGVNIARECSEQLNRLRSWAHRGYECYGWNAPDVVQAYVRQRWIWDQGHVRPELPRELAAGFSQLDRDSSRRATQVRRREDALDRTIIPPRCRVLLEWTLDDWLINRGSTLFGLEPSDRAAQPCPVPPGYQQSSFGPGLVRVEEEPAESSNVAPDTDADTRDGYSLIDGDELRYSD